MALQSQLFRGDTKLEDAAVSDTAHIVPGARGPHVVKIQQALIDVAGADIVADGVYGSATADAVADFKRKQKPQILNFAGRIDNIVGIQTMAALDGMLPKGGRLRLNFGFDITLVDIVVNFIGATGAGPRDAEEALPVGLLLNTYAALPDPLNRKLLRHKTNNRILFRVAQNTNAFGPESVTIFLQVLSSMALMLGGTDPANGNPLLADRIFILGSSSGGRNALDFVDLVLKSGLRPHFVAPIDASFFQEDTPDRPKSTAEPVEPIPTFTGPFAAVIPQVPNRHNFFQRRGNHAKRVFNPLSKETFLYTSKMDGNLPEIHGKIAGFKDNENHEVATGGFGLTDEKFHEFCDAAGRLEAQRLIAKELRGF